MKRRLLFRCLMIVAAVAALLIVAFWKPLLIAHHRHEMISTRDRILANCNKPTPWERLYGRVFIPSDRCVEEWGLLGHHEYHMLQLARLGDLQCRKFVLKHVLSPSSEEMELWRQVREAFRDNIDYISEVPHSPKPMTISVCDRPERIAQWERFLADRDVPDFRERFMRAQNKKCARPVENTLLGRVLAPK